MHTSMYERTHVHTMSYFIPACGVQLSDHMTAAFVTWEGHGRGFVWLQVAPALLGPTCLLSPAKGCYAIKTNSNFGLVYSVHHNVWHVYMPVSLSVTADPYWIKCVYCMCCIVCMCVHV